MATTGGGGFMDSYHVADLFKAKATAVFDRIRRGKGAEEPYVMTEDDVAMIAW
jgi:hypothetical protein